MRWGSYSMYTELRWNAEGKKYLGSLCYMEMLCLILFFVLFLYHTDLIIFILVYLYCEGL
jgi:hypothetical protein